MYCSSIKTRGNTRYNRVCSLKQKHIIHTQKTEIGRVENEPNQVILFFKFSTFHVNCGCKLNKCFDNLNQKLNILFITLKQYSTALYKHNSKKQLQPLTVPWQENLKKITNTYEFFFKYTSEMYWKKTNGYPQDPSTAGSNTDRRRKTKCKNMKT